MRIIRRHDALVADDVITPVHHHSDESKDVYVAQTPDGTQPVSPERAAVIASECSLIRDIEDVPVADDGPTGLGGVRRRGLLQAAGVGLGALLVPTAVPRLAFDASSAEDVVVCVFLRGGMDGLSAVVPVADPNYYRLRPTTGVKPEQTWSLDGSYGMNSTMSALRPMWEERDLAVVLGAGNPEVTRSHFDDMDTMELAQGSAPAQVRTGWLARHLASMSKPGGTFRAITIGNRVATSLTTNAFEALAMTDIKSFDILDWSGERDDMLASLDAMYRTAGGELASVADATMSAVTGMADLRDGTDSPDGGAVYPGTPFGRGLRDVARIIKAGKGLQAACVDLGGWDHHSELTGQFSTLSEQLAKGLAAFRADLGPAWEKTTVVTMSEFGRRARQNSAEGTDHGHGNLMMFAGGGVRGGIYGSQPRLETANLELGEDVPTQHDYRTGLSEMLTDRLGNGANLDAIFPGYRQTTPLDIF